jgi:hypothetical protein
MAANKESQPDAHINPFLIASGAFLAGCLIGTAAAIVNYGPDRAIGPLSEWLPGTVTALALTYTLVEQRKASERIRKERAEWEAALTQAQAEHVFVWIERRQVTMGADVCVLRWSNTSAAPAYSCVAILTLSDGTLESVPLGTLPPEQRLAEAELHRFRIPTNTAPTPLHAFPVGAGCEFRDAGNREWRRGADGVLVRR